MQHKYCVSQNIAELVDYDSSNSGSKAFRTDQIPISSIAISSGSADPGVFELKFNGP